MHYSGKMRGGGGRSFSSRGGAPNDRNHGGKFRDNSYRDRGSGGGRFNNNQSRGNDRRFDDNFNKPGSSMRNRSRYDRRSPDRFSHGNNDRSSRVCYLYFAQTQLCFYSTFLTFTHLYIYFPRTMDETMECRENGHVMM